MTVEKNLDPKRKLTKHEEQVIREQLESGTPPRLIAADLQIVLSRVAAFKAHVSMNALNSELNRKEMLDRAYRYAKQRVKAIGGPLLSRPDCDALWTKQQGKCALTGLPFNDHNRNPSARVLMRPWRPSLDRKKSTGGYSKGNVQLVAQCANFARNEWPNDVFFEMCTAAATLYSKQTAKHKRAATKAAATRKIRRV